MGGSVFKVYILREIILNTFHNKFSLARTGWRGKSSRNVASLGAQYLAGFREFSRRVKIGAGEGKVLPG